MPRLSEIGTRAFDEFHFRWMNELKVWIDPDEIEAALRHFWRPDAKVIDFKVARVRMAS